MRNILKKAASILPIRYQQEMKRIYFRHQIHKDTFHADEPEYSLLEKWLNNGDFVLDIGANVGHYTRKISDLIGTNGRVIAFEPVRETFELLASNITRYQYQNVTLFNVAASNSTEILGMGIPKFEVGLNNYYRAYIDKDSETTKVFTLAIDSLNLPFTIQLVKMDVEGYELPALEGMQQLLYRDHPRLIIEGDTADVAAFLENYGYSYKKIKGSPNRIWEVPHHLQ